MQNFIDFHQIASEMIHADGQIDRPFFALCIYFGYYLQEKRNRWTSRRTYGSKWQKAYSKMYVLEPAIAVNFSVVFPVPFALDDRLLISVFLEDIELICQIQRDLELG